MMHTQSEPAADKPDRQRGRDNVSITYNNYTVYYVSAIKGLVNNSRAAGAIIIRKINIYLQSFYYEHSIYLLIIIYAQFNCLM